MKYIEDDFDLAEFKRTFRQKNVVPERRNIFMNFVLTVFELALAFVAAYYLFKGGQYLIDMFLN